MEKMKDKPKVSEAVMLKEQIIEKGLEAFDDIKNAPEVYRSLNDYAKERTVKTFGKFISPPQQDHIHRHP